MTRNKTATVDDDNMKPSTDDGGKSRWTSAAAFFLATAADSSSNAFLPVFARTLQPGITGLPPEMAAGLPIAAFWLMVAAAQLTTFRWETGRDHRWLLAGALSLSALAQLLSGFAGNALELTAWRGLNGFTTGIVMILVQDGMLRTAGEAARTKASGVYLGIFFAGTIAGTLGGGFVAGQSGHHTVFFIGAATVGLAALLAATLPSYREGAPPQVFRLKAALGNPAFLALILLGALPSRLLISAFLYYLAPLRLHDLGLGVIETGWILALYAAIMSTTAPLWSRLADHSRSPLLFTLGGLGLSAAALLVAPLGPLAGLDSRTAIIAAVALLGTAQAIGMAPQVTLLFQVAGDEMRRFGRAPVLGLFRVFERMGLFAGPLLAGLLVELGGDMALAVLALVAAAAVPALALTITLAGRHSIELLSAKPETIP